MARFIKPGEVIDYLNEGEKLLEGDVVALGDHGIGVAASTIEHNAVGSVYTSGVWEMPNAGEAIPLGAEVFYDADEGEITLDGTGNAHAGWAVQAAAAIDPYVLVKIG